jgi:hypothetical protein
MCTRGCHGSNSALKSTKSRFLVQNHSRSDLSATVSVTAHPNKLQTKPPPPPTDRATATERQFSGPPRIGGSSKATLSNQTIWTRGICLQVSILDDWVPCLNFAPPSRAHFD